MLTCHVGGRSRQNGVICFCEGNMKIKVQKPFTYYIDGYKRRDFSIGEHDVPYDCAAFAEQSGFTKREEKCNVRGRTRNNR